MVYRIIVISCMLFLLIQSPIHAQLGEPGLTNQIYSVKAGIFGAWLSFEQRLDKKLTLNTELGFNTGYGLRNRDGELHHYFLFSPSLDLEPRYYYNLDKRIDLGRDTRAFGANYFSLDVSWMPDVFDDAALNTGHNFSIVPKWGLRRNIGKRFFFEAAAGVGAWFGPSKPRIMIDTDLRFGIRF